MGGMGGIIVVGYIISGIRPACPDVPVVCASGRRDEMKKAPAIACDWGSARGNLSCSDSHELPSRLRRRPLFCHRLNA
jgi:hypothetical protein